MADNTTLNAGSGGDVIATDDIGGVKHQLVKIEFGADGSATQVDPVNPLPVSGAFFQATQPVSLVNSRPAAYQLFISKQAVGAGRLYFDLFNATGSEKNIRVRSVVPIVSGAVAVTGVLGVDLFLARSTAVGTGGTTVSSEGTSFTAPTFSKMNPSDSAIPAQITARITPTGGATQGAVLVMLEVFTEETNAANYLSDLKDFIRHDNGIVVPQNSGVMVVQGAVASVGNIAFMVTFELE